MNLMEKLNNCTKWQGVSIGDDIQYGDMPGDKVEIGPLHIAKANTIFERLLEIVKETVQKNNAQRVVISVCGGSGVGKSETASLLSYYFKKVGIGSYTLSGDNYPHRIPVYNDAERLRMFRKYGLKTMIEKGDYTEERFKIIQKWQQEERDADEGHKKEFPWFESYLEGGKKGLKEYLGTDKEIDFSELSEIIAAFKKGENHIWLKRMGRTDTQLWYEKYDFTGINILVIEWTHGNSDFLEGVDIPILLNSTPRETLEHRRMRNRDGKTDSPFTMRVLEIEQSMLEKQASKAKIILSKSGELLDFEAYQKLMKIAKEQTV